jgi:hypothetical protein
VLEQDLVERSLLLPRDEIQVANEQSARMATLRKITNEARPQGAAS